jgi:hypothetical protein
VKHLPCHQRNRAAHPCPLSLPASAVGGRLLAQRSKQLLERYRRGESVPESCPLREALAVISSPRDELLDFLRRSQATPAAKALLLKRTLQEFVLEYGWWYEPAVPDVKIPNGTPQQCHTNATNLTLEDDSLIYCEGYALFKSGSQPTVHAWVTDGRGRAIDNTWPKPGVVYAGVPFRSLFVNMTALKNRATVSLLDDFQNNYPLRGELGDRPGEWLDLRGRGTERVGRREAADEMES